MPERWLVFSDMDGTLLNHHDYRVDAALPMLQRLQNLSIPVIFNTSKTLREMQKLARQLHNPHPFIIENGSAIVMPDNYFSTGLIEQLDVTTHSIANYRVLVTGTELEHIQAFIQRLNPPAIDFTRCSTEQAVQITGLTDDEARAAQSRAYSVPLLFESTSDEQDFVLRAEQAGFSTLRGGRFLHVLGDCDKGRSMLLLKALYEQHYSQSVSTLAIGDSPNDLDMLTRADRAVIVRSPSSESLRTLPDGTVFTRKSAPEGWAEGIQAGLELDDDTYRNNLFTENQHGG